MMRFLADEIRGDLSVGQFLDAFDLFAEAHRRAAVAHVVAERFDHLGVGKFEQARALFDDDDAHAERGEHAGVLDADDAAADHDQGARHLRHRQNLIAINNVAAVDRHLRIGRRASFLWRE